MNECWYCSGQIVTLLGNPLSSKICTLHKAAPAMLATLRRTLKVMKSGDRCPSCFTDNLTGEHGAICITRAIQEILDELEVTTTA